METQVPVSWGRLIREAVRDNNEFSPILSLYFISEETEAQIGKVTNLRSQSQVVRDRKLVVKECVQFNREPNMLPLVIFVPG